MQPRQHLLQHRQRPLLLEHFVGRNVLGRFQAISGLGREAVERNYAATSASFLVRRDCADPLRNASAMPTGTSGISPLARSTFARKSSPNRWAKNSCVRSSASCVAYPRRARTHTADTNTCGRVRSWPRRFGVSHSRRRRPERLSNAWQRSRGHPRDRAKAADWSLTRGFVQEPDESPARSLSYSTKVNPNQGYRNAPKNATNRRIGESGEFRLTPLLDRFAGRSSGLFRLCGPEFAGAASNAGRRSTFDELPLCESKNADGEGENSAIPRMGRKDFAANEPLVPRAEF